MCDAERATLMEVANTVDQRYVIESKATTIANTIREHAQKSDSNRVCKSKKEFSSSVTEYLREVSGDGHFYFETNSGIENNDWISEWKARGEKNGFGIQRVEILDQNIGLIKISTFYDLETAFERFNAAFQITSDTSGLILDLRGNGGGSSETEWPLQWTFLEPDSDAPLRLESRNGQAPRLDEPPVLWPRYGSKRPLVILVDSFTFSAPEAIAYSLQSLGRATIIGERTGGGAHMLGEGVVISQGYKLYTPETRPVGTKTGKNWEKVGVIPDILINSNEALKVASKQIKMKLANN
jgi:C-terminal processing protease CtpA/Prc